MRRLQQAAENIKIYSEGGAATRHTSDGDGRRRQMVDAGITQCRQTVTNRNASEREQSRASGRNHASMPYMLRRLSVRANANLKQYNSKSRDARFEVMR